MTESIVDPMEAGIGVDIRRIRIVAEDWASTGYISGVLKDEPVNVRDPAGGSKWEDASFSADIRIDTPPGHAVTDEAELRWETEDGEWQSPEVRVTEVKPDYDAVDPLRDALGEWESCRVVEYDRSDEMRETVETALASVRPVTLQRVIALDLLTEYEAEMEGDVWQEYANGRADASVDKFVESMSGRQAADILELRGEEVFDAEWASSMAGRPRAMRDVLAVWRYFH
jgi:hypothetical protein